MSTAFEHDPTGSDHAYALQVLTYMGNGDPGRRRTELLIRNDIQTKRMREIEQHFMFSAGKPDQELTPQEQAMLREYSALLEPSSVQPSIRGRLGAACKQTGRTLRSLVGL